MHLSTQENLDVDRAFLTSTQTDQEFSRELEERLHAELKAIDRRSYVSSRKNPASLTRKEKRKLKRTLHNLAKDLSAKLPKELESIAAKLSCVGLREGWLLALILQNRKNLILFN